MRTIREIATCRESMMGVGHVLHQAALGSVPRSIEDPIRTNQSNIDGFLNMLVAARDTGIQRFVYAASSSTYGEHRDFRPGDVLHSLASIDKARGLLGYEPSHSIREGLKETMDWYVQDLVNRG